MLILRIARAVTIVAIGFAAGCTHWDVVKMPGERVEISRTAKGEPYTVRRTSAGFDIGAGNGLAGGGASTSESAECVQRFDVEYKQTYETVAELDRSGDLIGSVVVASAGALLLATSYGFHDEPAPGGDGPRDWSSGMIIGGTAVVGGVTWLALSHALLPSDAPPEASSGEDKWTEEAVLPSVGCQAAAAQDGPSIEDRLRALDELKEKGLVTDDEYKTKRVKILENL